MKRACKFTVLVLILIILTGSITNFKIGFSEGMIDRGTADTYSPDELTSKYSISADHAPLVIISNLDFATNGWSGEGTEEIPYLMEGIEITNSSIVVSISDTDAFFVIRDSNLTFTGTKGSCVAFKNVRNGVIENCTIISNFKGVEMNYSQDCKAIDNKVGPCVAHGIHLYQSSYIQVSDNEVMDIAYSGLGILDSCINIESTDDSVISGNEVSNAPHLIFLSSSDRIELLSNHFSNPTMYDALLTVTTNECIIRGNNITSSKRGMNLNSDVSCLIENNKISVYDVRGLLVRNGYDITVRNNNVSGSLFGCDFQGLNNYIITGNTVHHSQFGLAISEYFTNSEISNNTAYACDFGFFIQGSIPNAEFIGCTAYHNDRGFYVQSASGSRFYRNVAFENNVGFELADYGQFELIGNLVYNNTVSGISIKSGCTNNMLYKNSIISDSVVDNGADNMWDDGVNHGNYWDDYSGVGNYDVPGIAGSQDRYPSTYPMPVILEAETVEYGYSTTGNEIIWPVVSVGFPDCFEVYQEGILITSECWDGNEIVFPVDGLDIGTHNFTAVVYDYFGNSNSSAGMVIVSEYTSPTTTSTTSNGTVIGIEDLVMIVAVVAGSVILVAAIVVFVKYRS